jgi:hypothetical protein
MTFFYFFPFNFLFIFILSNIFLAIINQTYSEALKQAAELRFAQSGGGGGDSEDDVDMLRALFYCFRIKNNYFSNDSEQDEVKKSKAA